MQILLNLLAGVSLLVWGTQIIRTGILRLYGGDLRRVLRRSLSHRATALPCSQWSKRRPRPA